MCIRDRFWATEGWHGIAGWMPALGGVILLFLLGRLHVSDLSAINPKFLIFLMAAFNIGQVLRNSGVMAAIMEQLKTLSLIHIFLRTLLKMQKLLGSDDIPADEETKELMTRLYFYLLSSGISQLNKQGHPAIVDWVKMSPVSYTHLDVYKRQLLRRTSP